MGGHFKKADTKPREIKLVPKLTAENLPSNEVVKFWGKIDIRTCFVITGQKNGGSFSLDSMRIPADPFTKAEESEQLYLFVGPTNEALKEIEVTRCEHFPLNMTKPTIVESDKYKFFFPAVMDIEALERVVEKKLPEQKERFATCNNQWIEVWK